MNRFLKRCGALLTLLFGLQSALSAAPARKTSVGNTKLQTPVQHVVIVSFDGGKPSVMKESRMPIFFAMALKGAHTFDARTIYPSVTLPSHTSMLTGVGPDKHRVLWNDYRPRRGAVLVPTIFGIARANGLRTAAFAGKPKFRHLNVEGTLHAFDVPSYRASVVAETASNHIKKAKPHLLFVHFSDPDGAGHQYGWGSSEQKKAFADSDAALNVLRRAVRDAGLEKNTVFIMSADHGGHGRTHGSDLPADMIIPWVTWGASVRPNFEISSPVTTYDTAATALWLLGVPVPASFDGKPVMSAFRLKN